MLPGQLRGRVALFLFREFSKNHMEVVEPSKHEKNFDLRVQPGHDMIILARARDEKVESWKFPPKMNVKLEPLF